MLGMGSLTNPNRPHPLGAPTLPLCPARHTVNLYQFREFRLISGLRQALIKGTKDLDHWANPKHDLP